MRLVPLFFAAFLALLMAVTQYYALELYWYWTYWWLDIVMHTAGGIVIGLLVATYVSPRASRVILLTMLIGVLWEVFEYVLGISRLEPHFQVDTGIDLTMDCVGACLAYGMMGLWQTSQSALTAGRDASPDQTSS
jgi:hypothetical protein